MMFQSQKPQHTTHLMPTPGASNNQEHIIELSEEDLDGISGGAPWLLVGAVLLLWPR